MSEDKMAETTSKKSGGMLQDITSRMGILGELMGFLWKRKLYWLIPMLLTLVIIAVIIVLGSAGPGGIFIYTLF